jgi:PTH1 family peptidyl-tRNA hydrolase
VLAKPSTWMNESGGSVAGLASFFKVDPAHVLVVHDDLELDLGTVRLKRGGGEGGHNGLRSVSASLGTRDYARLRIGIGRPPGRQDPADFVLKQFPGSQREEVALAVGDAVDAVLEVLRSGWETAQKVVGKAP